MQTKTIILISLLLPIGSFMKGQISDNVGDNTRFGQAAGLNNANSDTEILQISFFGRSAGLDNTGAANSFFGYSAGRLNSTGIDNSFFGHRTGFSNTIGSRNSFFGRLAGQFNEASDNSFFGYAAGDSTTTGGANSFFGKSSGFSNTTGASNNFFGTFSGARNTTGNQNSFFGTFSGARNTVGNDNSFFGRSSGFNIIGSFNIAIGSSAGPPLDTPGNPSFVDSTLYIDIHATDDPLIYGQFNQRIVRINGSFEAMGGVSNSSDINRKEAIVPINELGVLEKVSELELSEWSYKDASDIRHLGPMAQDFYKAFGLGKNEKTIGTLDADGVALASIQALYQLWQEEKEINRDQNDMIQSLLTRLEKLENE